MNKFLENKIMNVIPKISNKVDPDLFEYRCAENNVWFDGNPGKLMRFYRMPSPYDPGISFSSVRIKNTMCTADARRGSFWPNVYNKPSIAITHVPLASEISHEMANLLFGKTPELHIVEDGDPIKQKRLDEILEKNNFKNILQRAALYASSSGGVAIKININKDLFDFPLIELYRQGDFEIKEISQHVIQINFKNKINEDYELRTECGIGYIYYQIYDLKKKEIVENPGKIFPGFKEIYIFEDENGKTIDKLTAIYVPNTAANTEFPDSVYGESDYSQTYTLFDNLDALMSFQQTYVKYGCNVKESVSLSEVINNDDMGISIKPDDWGGHTELVIDDSAPNPQVHDFAVPQLQVDAFEKAILAVKKEIILKSGLSLVQFGLDAPGRNASAEALELRETRNYNTREKKKTLWETPLEELSRLLLIYDSLLSGDPDKDGVIKTDRIENNIYVQWPEYEEKTEIEKALEIDQIRETGLISDKDAVKMFWSDKLTEDELNEKLTELTGKTLEEIAQEEAEQQ